MGNYRMILYLPALDDIVYYFGDYFGYISGQIVNKKLWDEVVEENKDKIGDYFNAYVHIFVILNMIKKIQDGFISVEGGV